MKRERNITVFGATGRIGKELLGSLSQAGIPVTAVTRNKSKAPAMPFVEWVEADMSDKESLYGIMEKGGAVFLASGMSAGIRQEQGNVIEVAKSVGAGHLIKLSSAAVDESSPFYIGESHIAKAHGEIEQALKASGIPWTLLQPNGFMQNWLGGLSKTVKEERKIYDGAGDGKRAYLDVRDIAEVAFNVITEPAQHIGKTYLLTGGEALNYAQVAATISAVLGETVTYIPLPAEEFKRGMEQKGLPAWLIHTFIAYTEAQRDGLAAFVSNSVKDILHKPERNVDAFVRDHIEWFQ